MGYPVPHDLPASNLADLLKIERLPLIVDRQPFRQLEYIRGYAEDLGCTAVLVESDYIDRDYMQDHSAFYASSFANYGFKCRRLHFFSDLKSTEVIDALNGVATSMTKGKAGYDTACREFSEKHYQGFAVIKPLPGSPVGRTILRTYPAEPTGEDYLRRFEAVRDYSVHLLGAELTIRGLGFQQQDQGVSACATTAIWTSIQKLRDFEDVAAATPAQITASASRFALPFGRSLPSEGLSLDQMCQGIHALGVSPNLVRIESFRHARSMIFAAAISGIAPILIIRSPKGSRHAVSAAGIKVRKNHQATIIAGVNAIDDMSGDLLGVYIHDDRIGPYVRTKFEEQDVKGEKVPCLVIREDRADVCWTITHLLMPVHGKIRTGVSQMLRFSTKFARFAYVYLSALGMAKKPVQMLTRISRAHRYVEELLTDIEEVGSARITEFFQNVQLSRYVGVTSLNHPDAGRFDVLVDSTGTERNSHCLAIVCRGKASAQSANFLSAFGKYFKCVAVK
jgi:hypothetical protein